VRQRAAGPWVLVIVATLVLGAAGGVLWQTVPRVHFLITTIGPFPVSEQVAGRVAEADVWLGVIGAGLGLVLAVTVMLGFRQVTPVESIVAVIAAVVAVGLAFVVGQLVANGRILWTWAPVAGDNHEVVGPLVLRAWGVVTLAPIIACVALLLTAVFSREPRTESDTSAVQTPDT